MSSTALNNMQCDARKRRRGTPRGARVGEQNYFGGFMKISTLLFLISVSVITVFLIPATADGQLIISEFRLRGVNGANDEFIEIYNNSGSDHVVLGFGTGYAVVASDSVTRCVIPNGTIIPNRGHFLCTNSVGYSLAAYPSGNGLSATGDAIYSTDIPDNAGLALFNTTLPANFVMGNRMDAVGSTSVSAAIFKEGTGYPALTPFSINYSFYRDICGKSGSIITMGNCTVGEPKDTNNNAADFVFVDTSGTSAGAGQRLGAPGPENLSSPRAGNPDAPTLRITPIDSCVTPLSGPNAIRDQTSDPANNSTFGTLDLRFRVRNLTGSNLTRLRFRIVDLSTFPAANDVADLRPRTVVGMTVSQNGPPCDSGTSNIFANGTQLESSGLQAYGGGFNSSLSIDAIAPQNPWSNGSTVSVRVLLGVEKVGKFKIGIVAEALPGNSSPVYYLQGSTDPLGHFELPAPFDFGTDSKTDVSIFRPSAGQWWYRNSATGLSTGATFGLSVDKPVPADYTGDGVADRAFYRPLTGEWVILRSEDGTFYSAPFGINTDIPAPADYDGDGKADLAVFRPSVGTWFISLSTGGNKAIGWGQAGDQPVPGDYDGDGKADIAIWRADGGQWWVLHSSGGYVTYNFGASSDKAVPGDYTGDRRTDVAFWRPVTGQWFILRSEDNSYFAAPFGANGDLPIPGDYDGDNKFDVAVFRPSSATWFINNSGGSPVTIMNYGFGTDTPLPYVYVK